MADSVHHPHQIDPARRNHPLIVLFAIWVCQNCAHPVLGDLVSHSPSQSAGNSAKDATDSSNSAANFVRREGIDSSLFKYAFLALTTGGINTGTIYNVTLAPTLDGIQAQTIRLRTGSLKKYGLAFNEFSIPIGASVDANSSLLVMIYRNIFNFTVYSLPTQYEFGGPVVGIVTYSPFNLTTFDSSSPEIPLTFPNKSIRIQVPMSRSSGTSVPLCAFFSVNGTVTFTNLTSLPNICTSATLGDVALVLPSSNSPSPESSAPAPASLESPLSTKVASHWKLIVAITCLALAGVAFCIAVALISVVWVKKMKVATVDRSVDDEEPLDTSLIGDSRAPTAVGIRTKPTLEMDMARFTD